MRNTVIVLILHIYSLNSPHLIFAVQRLEADSPSFEFYHFSVSLNNLLLRIILAHCGIRTLNLFLKNVVAA